MSSLQKLSELVTPETLAQIERILGRKPKTGADFLRAVGGMGTAARSKPRRERQPLRVLLAGPPGNGGRYPTSQMTEGGRKR